MHLDLTPFPELTTPRLLLRELSTGDVNEIFLLRSDKSVNAFVDRVKATSTEDALQFINMIIAAQRDNKSVMWAIVPKGETKLIGTIVYWNIVREKDEAEVGYELLPAYHGQGIMQEALSKVIGYGFKTMKLKTIVAEPKAGNTSSVRLLERSGFSNTGATEGGYLIYKLESLPL